MPRVRRRGHTTRTYAGMVEDYQRRIVAGEKELRLPADTPHRLTHLRAFDAALQATEVERDSKWKTSIPARTKRMESAEQRQFDREHPDRAGELAPHIERREDNLVTFDVTRKYERK